MAKKAKKTAEKKTKKATTSKSAEEKVTKKASKTAEKKTAKVAKKKTKKKTKKVLAEEAHMNEMEKKWADLQNKHGKVDAPAYKMSSSFEAQTPIQHKVLGWGWILTNENDRLEVLFKDGTKTLISNYKK